MQENIPSFKPQPWWPDLVFLTLVLGTLLFTLLGNRPLFVPDEGRYAEIAREMVTSGDYITPHLNDIKYFEKPILFFWLGAAAIKVGGLNIWSLRIINALLGLIGCLLTYCTARQLYDRTTGLLAALILGTSGLYFCMAHMISLDLPITVFMAACLYAFLLGSEEPFGKRRRLYLWSAAVAAALAVLTKGLIGIVLPGMIVLMWIALLNDWRLLTRLYLPSAICIFLLITLPWHLLVSLHNPEFFYFYFIEQQLLRYTELNIGHYEPLWFFIPAIMIGFFPWIVFLPQTLATVTPRSWSHLRLYRNELFLILWAGLIFIFFSFSKSKLIPYILTLFPPLSILTAHYLVWTVQRHQHRGIYTGTVLYGISASIIAYVIADFTTHTTLKQPTLTHLYLYAATIFLSAGALMACVYVFRDEKKSILITLGTSWLFLLTLNAASPSLDTRTVLPLAQILRPLLQPQDDVVAYNVYYQDLPFYLERRISVLNWKNELGFGMKHQDTHDWMINDTIFWQRWHSNRRVFALMQSAEFQLLQKKYPNQKFYVLGSTPANTLVSNKD